MGVTTGHDHDTIAGSHRVSASAAELRGWQAVHLNAA